MAVIFPTTPLSAARPVTEKAEPCVIVIFGASGDLTRRKLLPAIYRLACSGGMSTDSRILGIGGDAMDEDAYCSQMREAVAASEVGGEFDEVVWQRFAQRLRYMAGDLRDGATYRNIATRLGEMEMPPGASCNLLFYCATPPSLAPVILEGLGAVGLAEEDRGWSRIIVEKPFGRDLASAQALNAQIARVFDEHQVYRIDHYLGKETVQNILVFRFGNALFEPVWNRTHIEHVEITAAETVGVGSRAGYYEEAGALRDMVANHLLQLLALTAMEPPIAFDADAVRDQKVQVWRSIHPMTPAEVAERTVRGQYDAGEVDGKRVPGYRDEKDVAKDSSTETYAAVEFGIDNWRWAGVPFYVRTGKRLGAFLTEIALHFKRPPQALFARATGLMEPNVITLRIQPDEGISVAFGAKRPGAQMQAATVEMVFGYQQFFGARLPAAYETLLLDAMLGDATLFIRRDAVEAQWRLISPIEEAWTQQSPPGFPNYAAGSEGPAAAAALLARNGHHWRPLR
jgi:glucose-6-phosphate 1-dehydrogenase